MDLTVLLTALASRAREARHPPRDPKAAPREAREDQSA